MLISITPRRRLIQRTQHAPRPLIEHMRVNHGCLNILVTQEFLNRSNVVSGFQEVSSKGMPKRVTTRQFDQTSC